MFRAMIVVVCLATSAWATAKVKYEEHTIGGNRAIPNRIVENSFDQQHAATILETPYDGFYQISGKAGGDSCTFRKVSARKSYPDDRWAKLAKGITRQVNVPAPSTGSRIKPSATAYVVFYEGGIEGFEPENVQQLTTSVEGEPNTLAILVIKQSDSSGSTRFTGFGAEQNIFFFELTI